MAPVMIKYEKIFFFSNFSPVWNDTYANFQIKIFNLAIINGYVYLFRA